MDILYIGEIQDIVGRLSINPIDCGGSIPHPGPGFGGSGRLMTIFSVFELIKADPKIFLSSIYRGSNGSSAQYDILFSR